MIPSAFSHDVYAVNENFAATGVRALANYKGNDPVRTFKFYGTNNLMGRVLIFSLTRTSQIVSGQPSRVQPCMLINLSQWMTDVLVPPIVAQKILSKLPR